MGTTGGTYLISGDLEGMSGFTWDTGLAENDRILHAHYVAAAHGLHDGGASQVLLKSFHGIPGEYPGFVRTIREPRPGEFDLPGIGEANAGLALVGFHGLPPECATGHAYRFSNLWLNGKRIGEVTIQVMRATAAGVPTVFFAGDGFGAQELREVAPDAVVVVLREGKDHKEGATDPGALTALREGAERAAAMRGKVPLPRLPEKFLLDVPMANEVVAQIAQKAVNYPVKVEGLHVSRESNDFMETYRFFLDMFIVAGVARRMEIPHAGPK